MTFKIASWNVNSLRIRLSYVLDWLQNHSPDILALQETKIPNELFPEEEFKKLGYHAIFNGQKAYNGVAILSKEPSRDIALDFHQFIDPQRRILGATVGDVRILNLYIPNGQDVQSEKYTYKLSWLTYLIEHVQNELNQHQQVVLLGDFNIAPEEIDVHDPKQWEGKVLCTEPERAAFQKILSLGFADCFRLHSQEDKIFSWWDYRQNSFQRNLGLRIDHILSSSVFAKKCVKCYIDKNPRGFERPSDHAIVVAEFE